MFQNILIFGHSNIGDVIYDLAVVGPLRKHCPEAKISFLTSSRCRGIVEGYQGLNSVIILGRHGKNKEFLNRLRFTLELRKKKFDLIIVLSSSLKYLFLGSADVWRVCKSRVLQKSHPVDAVMDMLRSKGLTIEKAGFSFSVKDADAVFCEDFLKEKGVAAQDKVIGILPRFTLCSGLSGRPAAVTSAPRLPRPMKKSGVI